MTRGQETISSKDATGNSNGKIDSYVIKGGPQVLLSLFGYNSGAEQFIHLHDAAAQPLDGTVPLHKFKVAAADNYGVLIPLTGINFSKGIVACVSTTADTTTLGAKEVTMLATIVA